MEQKCFVLSVSNLFYVTISSSASIFVPSEVSASFYIANSILSSYYVDLCSLNYFKSIFNERYNPSLTSAFKVKDITGGLLLRNNQAFRGFGIRLQPLPSLVNSFSPVAACGSPTILAAIKLSVCPNKLHFLLSEYVHSEAVQ